MKTRGFTLLDLLASLGITATLAVLVSGAVSRTMDEGYRIRCLANMHNMASIYHIYADDHAGKLPSVAMLGNSSYRVLRDPMSLPSHFWSYLPSEEVWMCPAGRKSLRVHKVNYAWSRAQNLSDTNAVGARDAFDRMTATPLIWDNFTYALPSVYNVPEGSSGGPQAVTAALRYYPHSRGKRANYLYLDGHAETR